MNYNIQFRLFITFSALVIIVSLLYARMTYIFMGVTKEAIANILISQEVQRITNLTTAPLQKSATNSYFKIKNTLDYDISLLEQSPKDETLYSYNTSKKLIYVKNVKLNNNINYWVYLDMKNIAPFTILNQILSIFYWGIVLGSILLALLISWFLAKKLATPLIKLTHSIKQQTPQKKCDIYGLSRSDEIGQLANSFQKTYVELQQAWAREYDFTQDIGHELRTPITIIRNTLALKNSQTIDIKSASLIEQSTKSMQLTIDILLGLARKENLAFSYSSLVPCIERSVIDILKSYTESNFNVNIKLDNTCMVYGNPNLIQLLCHNLIYNCFVHGDSNSMQIRLSKNNTVIEFTNTFGLKKKQIKHNGLGRGTYLIKRIADTMCWQVRVRKTENNYMTELKTDIKNI